MRWPAPSTVRSGNCASILERLYWSLKYTRIDPRIDIDTLETATFELVETNFQRSGPEDVGVTHIISRGVVEPTRAGGAIADGCHIHRGTGLCDVRQVVP